MSYVPAGTAIDIPLYSLFRSSKYFNPDPDEFRPERFLTANTKGIRKKGQGTENEGFCTTAKNFSAFIPFSYGPANCVGRSLAIIELRAVTALMIRHFDMKLADGYDPDTWQKELKDWYIMHVGALPVNLALRIPILD